MKMEHMILYIIYACTIISLAFIPKNKWKEASLAFLFQQCVTWFLGLLVVELHLLKYPVMEFPNVNGTSFLFEFLAYPIICAFFCIYYPRKSTSWRKVFYISTFCTIMTISEIIFVKYTDLIIYVHWDWYITWLSLYASLFLLWSFYKWYFKLN
ncbi:CBO0543 family protein [Fredinandcohnia onubensis]|uniref:CBO0543 family protein n=1 Tax=Fredinandcohnia onubensis TaxID=1571209 RepID=UPI000C0BE85D|nr:CBO0543 family protein [Fredinandcohnia onubensis]